MNPPTSPTADTQSDLSMLQMAIRDRFVAAGFEVRIGIYGEDAHVVEVYDEVCASTMLIWIGQNEFCIGLTKETAVFHRKTVPSSYHNMTVIPYTSHDPISKLMTAARERIRTLGASFTYSSYWHESIRWL